MCGRFVLAAADDELIAEFAVDHLVGQGRGPSWNIAPTQPVRLIAESRPDGGRVRALGTARWGLLPPWATDVSAGARMINARSETVAVKPAFRAAAARRRCLIPADGYYEWMPGPGGKTPYFLHAADGSRLAMAGLYQGWRDPGRAADDPEGLRWTCAIITRPAPDALGHIHDRSPVIVPAARYDDWLDCADSSAAEADALLAGMPPPALEPRAVSRAVGNVRVDRPGLISPVVAATPDTLF